MPFDDKLLFYSLAFIFIVLICVEKIYTKRLGKKVKVSLLVVEVIILILILIWVLLRLYKIGVMRW